MCENGLSPAPRRTPISRKCVKSAFWRLGRTGQRKSGFLEVREIRVRKIRISGGWGDPGRDNKDLWRFGRSGYGKQRFLEVGEIRVRKIKIFGGWGNPGRENQDFYWGLGRSGYEKSEFLEIEELRVGKIRLSRRLVRSG